MKKFFLFACLSCGIFLPGKIYAQSSPDAGLENRVTEYAAYYLDSTGMQAALFSGKVQLPVTPRTESLYLRERGFKEMDDWGYEITPKVLPPQESYAPGTLRYNGITYPGVWMRLDLYRDQLDVLTPNKLNGIVLDPLLVGWADFHGYRSIYIPANSPEYRLPEGFYQLLFSGGHQVLKKETYGFNQTEQAFVNRKIRYYIEKDGRYHSVKGRKGAILRVLREHRRELDRYIRQNNIDIKQNTEQAIVTLVARYEALNNQVGL